MKLKNVFFMAALIISAGSILGCGSSPAHADERLARFLKQFDKEKAERKKQRESIGLYSSSKKFRKAYKEDNARLRKNNPWSPYKNKPFRDGLTPEQKTKYDNALKVLDCQTVSHLSTKGFIRLYPFLAAAFERGDVLLDFEKKITHFGSDDLRYCRFQKELLNVFDDIKRYKISLPPLKVESFTKDIKRKKRYLSNSTWESYVHDRCYAFVYILDLALREQHVLALRSALKIVKQRELISLPIEMEYHLLTIAKEKGIFPRLAKKRYDQLHQQLKPSQRLEIENIVKKRIRLSLGLIFMCGYVDIY